MKNLRLFLLSGLIFLIAFSLSLRAQETLPQAEQPQQEETKYTAESVGRVSFIEGKAFIQRAADIGFEEVVVNDPVAEGDRLGTSDGRMEIQFGRRNYLRLDSNTKVDVLNLPRKDNDTIRFRVWSGHVYFTINNLKKEKNIEIHTPDSSFYVLDNGVFRIDVEEGRGTEILVFKGLVEAAGEQNSYLVKSEQHLEMAEGRFSSRPSSFRPVADDSFDRWNQSRDQKTGRVYARRYLPEDLAEFEEELNQYGDWVYIPPYGYVWVPRNVGDDWRPYYYGRWVWIPLTGWTWVPYEPWGWVAFHYGRWHWAVGIGWYWIPHHVWGPAWVCWWWDVDYFAWAPLGWYGHPVVIINNVFYDRYVGYYPVHSRALVVVRKDQLRARDISRAALRPEHLKSVRLENRITLTSRQLPFRPEGSRLTVEKLDGKRVMVRQDTQPGGLRPSSGNIERRRIRPEGLAPSSRNEGGKTQSSGEKGQVIKPKSGSGEKGSSTARPSSTAPASGKVTPKKIKKKEEAPMPVSRYDSSTGDRQIRVYPSSPRISSGNLRPSETAPRTDSYRQNSSRKSSITVYRSHDSNLNRPSVSSSKDRYTPSRFSSSGSISSPPQTRLSFGSPSTSRPLSGSLKSGFSGSGRSSSLSSSFRSSSSRSGSVTRKK